MISLEYLKGKVTATLLVINESDEERRLITGYLKNRGFKTLEADNLVAGLPVMIAEKPDIVISDQMPPALKEYNFYRHFRYPGSKKDYFITLPTRIAEGSDEDEDHLGQVFHRLIVSEEVIMRAGVELQLQSARNRLLEKNVSLKKGLRLIEEKQKEAETEIEEAKRVQKGLLPRELPPSSQYGFSYFIEPSLGVGGDYIDVIDLGQDKAAVVLADVSGHGVSAGMMTGMLHAWIHSNLRADTGLAGFVAQLNDYIYAYSLAEKYVTLFLGVLDMDSHHMEYVLAGHPEPLLCANGAARFMPETTTSAIGLRPELTVTTHQVKLDRGDFFCIYSDGLIDGLYAYGHDVSYFADMAIRYADAIMKGNLQWMVRSLTRLLPNGSPVDDMALVVIRRKKSLGRVLLVQTEGNDSEALAMLLSANDYDMVLKNSCRAAIASLTRKPADILLVWGDALQDPDFAGIKTVCPKIMVGVLSAEPDKKDIVRSVRGGGDYYLRQPFTDADVLFMVNELRRFDAQHTRVRLNEARQGWYDFEISSSVDSLVSVQSFLDALLSNSMNEEKLWDIHFVINELGRNAIEWGNRHDVNCVVRISIGITDAAITVKIDDEGSGFDVTSALSEVNKPAHPSDRANEGKRAGGFGLRLITEMADEFMQNDAGNSAIIVFRRKESHA